MSMGIESLAPVNSKKAKDSSVRSFMLFLRDEGVTYAYVKECMGRDTAVQSLVALLDKFGMHLAFKEGRGGKPLARHSVMQYFRQVKNWLLDEHPLYRAAVEGRLLKMGRTLERYCMKRESGGFTNKATACTKSALRQMIVYLYANVSSPTDYQDAALLSVLWYLFGRASDLTLLHKQNLSISAGDVFFVRFIRMKTSEEQGLSLVPDNDFATCPILAIALALASQVVPGPAVFANLPEQQQPTARAVSTTTPLIDLLDHPADTIAADPSADASSGGLDSGPGIHSYVNRLLDRIAKPSGVDEHLTSHSFRRGGAQHANASSALSAQWIFDRGAWNMTTTSKAFAYVFNTPSEDTKVAKVLSDRCVDDNVELASLRRFDEQTQDKIKRVMQLLYSSCHGLASTHLTVTTRVLEVLMAYLLRHYASLRQLDPNALVVKRLEECATTASVSKAELLAWSSELRSSKETNTGKRPRSNDDAAVEDHPIFRQQAALIDQLVQMNKHLDRRVNAMESAISNTQKSTTTTKTAQEEHVSCAEPTSKRRKVSSVTNLKETWYAWYAHEPKLWESTSVTLKQKKSDSKLIVAFMKLFVGDDGFVLDATLNSYRDDVLAVGARAEQKLLEFLAERNIVSRGSGAVLKHMRKLHKAGQLNSAIARFERLTAAGKIRDPAPAHTRHMLDMM